MKPIIVTGLLGCLVMLFAGQALIVARPLAAPDAILSLASHEWERLPEVERMAFRYPHALVLLTRPRVVTDFNCHDCSRRIELLQRAGVAADRIRVLPVPAANTFEEAEACRDFVARVPINRLLLVTSPYHTRRALAVFRTVLAPSKTELGIEPASRFSPAIPRRWWAAPYDRWYVTYEWAATVYYAVRYRVLPIA